MEKKENDYDYSFIIVCIGGGGGVTFIKKISDAFNTKEQSNFGVDYVTRTVIINGEIIKLIIRDIGSQERYRPIRKFYIKEANGIFLFFDVTSKYSYDAIIKEFEFIRSQHKGIKAIMLIGNNCCDELREISEEEVNEFAVSHELMYREVKISTGCGIDEAVKELVTFLITKCKKKTDFKVCLKQRDKQKKNNLQNCI